MNSRDLEIGKTYYWHPKYIKFGESQKIITLIFIEKVKGRNKFRFLIHGTNKKKIIKPWQLETLFPNYASCELYKNKPLDLCLINLKCSS